jgi:uncharacterized protein YxjI
VLDITQYQQLVVIQAVEHLEVFTGIETENRYSIMTPEGETLLYAYEESGFFGRQFLNTHRPLTVQVIDQDGELVLTASRDFFWLLSHLYVHDYEDRPLGSLHRRFSVLNRRFSLQDPSGVALAEIQGSLFHPNTFVFKRQGAEVARITKQWSGIMREAFSDADTFLVQFDHQALAPDLSWLVLASAIAIDLDFFESKGGGFSVS